MSELLDPNLKDISATFETEFDGMAFESVTVRDLEAARTSLISRIQDELLNSDGVQE